VKEWWNSIDLGIWRMMFELELCEEMLVVTVLWIKLRYLYLPG
jgi:hypothetical protein